MKGLKHISDVPSTEACHFGFIKVRDVGSLNAYGTSRWPIKPGKQAEKSRFSAS